MKPKKPMSPSPFAPTIIPGASMGNHASITFEVTEEPDPDNDELATFGQFTRNWDQEVELDELLEDLGVGRVSDKQALMRAHKLQAKYPVNLEIQNFTANRLWALEIREQATEVWQKAYQQASALIPKGFKGQISWLHIDNRSFLRVAHGYLLGLMHQGNGKAAKELADKLLAWCPTDNLGIRMLVGDIAILRGDTKTAMQHFLNKAHEFPAHWYQAGQIAFRQEDYIAACTYMRRGIAANPYIAEGLTGRVHLNEHLYWHASTRNGPEWAQDYLGAPANPWTAQEINFVDWVFNSSAVLRERANLMEQHEGQTYERDAVRRETFALRSSYFVNELTDDLSKAMVKRIQNRFGMEIWPWERTL